MTQAPVRRADELVVGSKIDRYEIVRHVASGGMGSVWLGRLTGKHGFEKLVAIKTIQSEFASDPRFAAMFLDEARITSRLSHPNVAQVLDVGEHEGAVYIVFEWVDGRSLEALCTARADESAPLDLEFVTRTLIDICDGLHAAHELRGADGEPLGVVHRDVSPLNVLVRDDGAAKLIDFGVAKARDRVAPSTRSGLVKGTPQYMAPEQACGRPVDRRSDVWAVGATLYRALAGAPPFRDREELAAFVGGAAVRPLPESLPEPLRAVCRKALAREPEDRYPTARAMRDALEAALPVLRATGASVAPPAPRPAQPTTQLEARLTPEALAPTMHAPATPAPRSQPSSPPARSGGSQNKALAIALIAAAALTAIAIASTTCAPS